MKKAANYIKNKLSFLLAVTMAAVVGGVSTGLVMAAIPNASGQISGCYRNSGGLANPKGSLRVIDAEASENCGGNETALNWDQDGWKGYGYIDSTGVLDASRSKNVTSLTTIANGTGYCIFTDSNPTLITASGDAFSTETFRGADVRGTESAKDGALDDLCGTTAKAIIRTNSAGVSVYFFFR